jgi:hypothetical protein
MFLEFIPGSKQYLLTFLSVWWAIGQAVGSLISVSNQVTEPRVQEPVADMIVGLSCQLRLPDAYVLLDELLNAS